MKLAVECLEVRCSPALLTPVPRLIIKPVVPPPVAQMHVHVDMVRVSLPGGGWYTQEHIWADHPVLGTHHLVSLGGYHGPSRLHEILIEL